MSIVDRDGQQEMQVASDLLGVLAVEDEHVGQIKLVDSLNRAGPAFLFCYDCVAGLTPGHYQHHKLLLNGLSKLTNRFLAIPKK